MTGSTSWSWIYNNAVQYVSVSQHDTYQPPPRLIDHFDGTHPKIVYHKDSIGVPRLPLRDHR